MANKTNNVVTTTYLDNKLKSFKGELKDEIKNELYEIKDEIVGEIKSMREEFEAHQYSHARINDELSEHDKRMINLEAVGRI